MVWSSWGKSWGGGSGTSQTIFVDSFDLEMDVEEAILVDNGDDMEILLDNSEFVLEQEETLLSVEEEEFLLELEEEV